MVGETLKLSFWEKDTIVRPTFDPFYHSPDGNTLLWNGTVKVLKNSGIAEAKIMLTPNMAMLSGKKLYDSSKHKYYLLAEAANSKLGKITDTTPKTSERVLSPTPKPIPSKPVVPVKTAPTKPVVPAKKVEGTSILDNIIVDIKNIIGWDDVKPDDGNKKVVVEVTEVPKVEGIITAYFAKEEFTKEGTETAGQHVYKFARDNNNINKDSIADIIKKKVDAAVKKDKKYAKLDGIKTALTETTYKKDSTITFNLYKLEANFVKINSAPLEEEVFVVANTFLLDGKEVTIKIKEKEAVLVGADANLMVLEGKVNGNEITELKAVVEKGIAKVKIKLRPKADSDFKTWKEKLTGVKDGTHTYTFGSTNNTATPELKKKIAGIIAGKIKDTLAGLKKFAKVEVIEKALKKDISTKMSK